VHCFSEFASTPVRFHLENHRCRASRAPLHEGLREFGRRPRNHIDDVRRKIWIRLPAALGAVGGNAWGESRAHRGERSERNTAASETLTRPSGPVHSRLMAGWRLSAAVVTCNRRAQRVPNGEAGVVQLAKFPLSRYFYDSSSWPAAAPRLRDALLSGVPPSRPSTDTPTMASGSLSRHMSLTAPAHRPHAT
jgi:hypothetical protein